MNERLMIMIMILMMMMKKRKGKEEGRVMGNLCARVEERNE